MPEGTRDLRAEVAELDWYHTMELAPGIETPGWFDLRELGDDMPLPHSLNGLRCLDVGTFDGFWAFEMERRGASEVIACDILDPQQWDWPAGSDAETIATIGKRKAQGRGFEIARRELGSSVERRELSVYDLSSELGEFDFVYLGSLLLHLRDPVGALQRVHEVCRGTFVLCDVIDLMRTRLFPHTPTATLDAVGRPWWWRPNRAALQRMAEAAGFQLTAPARTIFLKPGAGHPPPPFKPKWLLSTAGREETLRAWRGDSHGVIVARRASQ